MKTITFFDKKGNAKVVNYAGTALARNHIKDTNYLIYDEDECYHIECVKSEKIISCFHAPSYDEAIDKAFKLLYPLYVRDKIVSVTIKPYEYRGKRK